MCLRNLLKMICHHSRLVMNLASLSTQPRAVMETKKMSRISSKSGLDLPETNF